MKPKKGQPMVYVALLVVVIAAMIGLRHCGDGGVRSGSLQQSGGDTIDVAIEYSPMMCYTYANTLGGFNYDLLRMLSTHFGRPMKFHPVVTLNDALDALEKGGVDVLVAQFPVTKENRLRLLFTDEVYIDKQVLVQKKRDDGSVAIATQLDLAGDTVYVVKGSPMKERISNLSREIGDSIFVKEEPLYGPEQLFLQVATGEIAYAVINRRIALDLAKRYENVDISTSISFSQIQAWAFAKQNVELQQTFNSWLKAIKETPQYDALLDRYMMK
ncbi:MAG: transporter substrate-binding domain-containing protein [Muribaculaceae bacterium]